jgi:uncharacterized protein (TIGR02118 family)
MPITILHPKNQFLDYFTHQILFMTRIMKKTWLAIVVLALFGCNSQEPGQSPAPTAGMFKVTILYPNGEGKSFDMNYYEEKHMPMMAGFIGDNLQFYEIDKGIAGRTANDSIPFLAVGYFYIRDVAEYNKAIAANRETIVGDIGNYTNIQPIIQISEVRKVAIQN